jgi:hypothetical protein
MAREIEIRYDEAQIARVRRMLAAFPRQVPRVLMLAINATISTLRSHAGKRIARAGGLKAKHLRRGTYVKKATLRDLVATLNFSGYSPPVTELGARQTRKGVTFSMGGRRVLLPAAFIATTPHFGRQVFVRAPYGETASFWRHAASWLKKDAGKMKTPRLPLWPLLGPSPRSVWEAHGGIRTELRQEGDRLLAHYTEQKLNYVLEKYGGTA